MSRALLYPLLVTLAAYLITYRGRPLPIITAHSGDCAGGAQLLGFDAIRLGLYENKLSSG